MGVPPVLLYVKAGCVHCDAQRAALAARGARIREIDIGERPDRIAELVKLTGGRRLVPVVVEGDRVQVAPEGGSTF